MPVIRLLLTLTHAANEQIKAMIASLHQGLKTIVTVAPQLPKSARWAVIVPYIVARIIDAKLKITLRPHSLHRIPYSSLLGQRGKRDYQWNQAKIREVAYR